MSENIRLKDIGRDLAGLINNPNFTTINNVEDIQNLEVFVDVDGKSYPVLGFRLEVREGIPDRVSFVYHNDSFIKTQIKAMEKGLDIEELGGSSDGFLVRGTYE